MMQLYNYLQRVQEEKKPRILFIASGLPILLISVLSMYLYSPMRSEKPEYAQLTNQGILLFILTMIHFLGGCVSLTWRIDYSIYKPLVACISWNGCLLLIVLMHVNHIIEYTKEWGMEQILIPVHLTILFTTMVIMQLFEHWNLYKNGQRRRD